MKIHGIELSEGSELTNLSVDSGSSFPVSPSLGELFYLNSDDSSEGLYVYNGTTWVITSQGAVQSKFNVAVVQKTPGTGEFSTITAAIDYIKTQTPSASSPWAVLVYPGIYTEASTIVMPTFTGIFGQAASAVTVQPAVPTNDVFTVALPGVRFENFTIRNATGTNAAGIRVTTSATPTTLNTLVIQNCFENLVLESTSSPVLVLTQFVRLTAGTSTKYLARVQSTGQIAQLRMFINNLQGTTGGVFNVGVFATGSGPKVDFNGTSVEGTGGGDGIVFQDGAGASGFAGVTVSSFTRNIVTNNVGAPPTLQLALSQSILSGTYDIFIAHPGTTGFFSGVANQSKIYIDPAAVISFLFNRSGADSGVTIVGGLHIGPTFEEVTEVTELIIETPPMGLMFGGEVTRAGGFDIAIAAGNGYVRKDDAVTRIEWNSSTLTLSPGDMLYIYIDSNAAVLTDIEEPSSETNIVLARVSASETEIFSITRTALNIQSYGNQLNTFLRNVIGPVYVSGSIVTENPSTARSLNVSAGHWHYSTQVRLPQAVQGVQFLDAHRDGSGDLVLVPSTVIDNSTIDTPTGLIAMTPGFFTKHVLYTDNDGIDLKFYLQHGQTEFATLEEAQIAPLPNILMNVQGMPHLAVIITQEGEANISDILDIRPRFGGAAGISSSGVSLHSDLYGLGADDHTQYLLGDGTRAMTGNLNLGTHDITNIGLINDIDISTLVTSVGLALPNTFNITNSPVTTSGVLTASFVNQNPNTVFAAPTTGSGTPSFRLLTAGDIPSHNQAWNTITGTPTTLGGYGITDARPAFTGDVTKPLNSNVLTLSSSGITSGTYKSLTIDTKGRAIAGTNPTTLDEYGISDAVPVTFLAVSNGVATLDATGRLTNEQIPTSLVGSVYKGTWNATTNTPTLASGVGTKGDFYIVSTAGSTNIDGISTWSIGDQIIFNGTVWQRIVGASSAVSSVAGRTGAIILTVSDISGAAVNSTVVHLSGSETITGTKTFSSLIIGSISGNAATVTTNANLTGDITSIGNTTTLPTIGTAGTYQVVTTDNKGRVISGANPTTLSGYGIIDGNPAFSGDVTKAANSTVLSLSSIGTPGTYRSVTTDSTGRVIAGTNPTTLAGYGITNAVNTSLLGIANGVATLDNTGKVLTSQLPASGASVYKGTWNAATNSPTIVSSVGVAGNYYSVSVAGSTNIDGTNSWSIGDQIIFNGSIWQRIQGASSAVSSVAGRTGAIVLTKADITDLVSRTITGSINQITVTDGDGIAGNPTIALASNPVIPGTGAVKIPIGSTGQQPSSPTAGELRFNSSSAKFEGYDGTWSNFATESFISTSFQPLDDCLTELSALETSGFMVHDENNVCSTRILMGGTGISITNGDGIAGDPTISLTGSLSAIEELGTTGVLTKIGSDTWATRSISGTTNQIIVSNSNAVSGNPTISLASNPVIPGTGSMTLPVGTTAERTVGPSSGAMRYNTSLNKFEFYQSGQWTAAINSVAPGVIPAQMTQLLTGQVPALTGTAIIPFDNVTPVSTNGTLLFTRSITMSAPAARIMLSFPYWIDVGSPNTTVITQVFRSPFTGYQIVNVGGNKISSTATNLVSGTTYTATITIDGTAYPISVLGSNAATYATLLTALQNAIGNAGTALLAGGNIKIISASSSITSTVAITAETLFAAPLSGFVSILTAVSGSTAGCLVSLPTTVGNSGRGNAASIAIVDIPGAGTFTYTVKIGSSAGAAWYINSSSTGNNFGGFNTTSYSLMEIN